jgi:hypothetical protein
VDRERGDSSQERREGQMRKLITLLFAALMALSFGPSFALATLGENPVPGKVVMAATPQAGPQASLRNITGEVVSVDKGARKMSLKELGWFTSEEVTFTVAEPAVPTLAELHPGDRVTVWYIEAHGQLIAKTITKISAERASGR